MPFSLSDFAAYALWTIQTQTWAQAVCLTIVILIFVKLVLVVESKIQRREDIAQIERESQIEWEERKPVLIHGIARSIRDSHPDHRFNLDEEERDFLSSLGISPDGPKAA
jgi:hypothetical protein